MTVFQTIILAIVEGLTEFLPVSSTGHLILASRILSIEQTAFIESFEIAIQSGAILAVVTLYRHRLLNNSKGWKRIMIAFLPTAIIGFVLYTIVKTYLLGNPYVVVVSLFFGGFAFILIERFFKPKGVVKNFSSLTYKQSFLIGIGQTISIIPGVSRSASTIITGMFAGLDRTSAAEFSFLLAVPTMFAATGLDIIKGEWLFSSREYLLLGIGCAGAYISALCTVKYFIAYIQKHTFTGFGIYRIVASLLFWLMFLR